MSRWSSEQDGICHMPLEPCMANIAIKCPSNGQSYYCNYKGSHPIVVLALVDGEYKFMWVEASTSGANSDDTGFGILLLFHTLWWERICLQTGHRGLSGVAIRVLAFNL